MSAEATPSGSAQLYIRLLKHVLPYKGVFAIAIVAMILTAVTETSFAALLKPIMDRGFVGPDPEFISIIPWLLIAVLLGRAISGFVASYSMAWVGRRIVYDLRQRMFERLVYLPSGFYDDRSSATLVSKLIYDVEQASTATTDALTLMIKDTLTVIALLGWMFYLDWQLTLVFIFFAPLVAFGVKTAADKFRKTSERIQDSVGGIGHVAKEAIIGQRVVKTFGGQDYEIDGFERANNRNRQQSMKKAAVSAAMYPMVLLFVGVAIAVVIYLAINRPAPNSITAGTFVSYLGAVLMIMSPLKHLAKVNEKIQMGVAAANSIFTLTDEPQEQDRGVKTIDEAHGHIQYRNVSFKYPRSNYHVLEDLSFEVEPGQVVALVGSSGTGKSTIASLLLGFYRPDSGEILLDGIDIREISLQNLRRNMAIVTQETILFDDTIRNNIVYGFEGKVSESKLRDAVEAAHVAEFSDRLARGLDTVVGEQGIRLSGGQRQRISIARALFKDAPILVFDEATSSLDSVSERLVREATEKLLADRTTLVIAHRLSTIEHADRILVLEGGRILESGRHQELIAKNGSYAQLYESQMLDKGRLAV